METPEIRLRLVEVVVGQATRVGLFDPVGLIDTCTKLENYVLDWKQAPDLPTGTGRRTLHRPDKTTGTPST